MKINPLVALLITCFLVGCQRSDIPDVLPILGDREVIDNDTVYHTIPEFSLLTQDSVSVTNADLDNYIYLSDFFFSFCPTICPKVKKQMLRIYKKYEDNDLIRLVSHSIDPKRDTPTRLKDYAESLNINTDKWMFLTGDKDELHDLAEYYFNSAFDDPEAPGGFNHSGYITLVDTHRRIRSFGLGTDPEDVDKLLLHIDVLLKEYETH